MIDGALLRDNPPNDPHRRPLVVYLPPGYDEERDRRYPVIYVTPGYSGHAGMWFNRTPFRQPYPELVDAPDGDWRVTRDEDADTLFTRCREACAASDKVIAPLALDDPGAQPTGDYTLRWALAHVTIDTSRHAGHADLVRELLNGERGW